MSRGSRRTTSRQPALRESAERIWLAGLGALAVTEEEGMRFFKGLVKKGEGVERLTRSRWGRQLATVRQAPTTAMRRIEGSVEHSVTDMLHRLGIPTRREIHSLTRRVESLADSLEKQSSPRRRRNGASRARAVAKRAMADSAPSET